MSRTAIKRIAAGFLAATYMLAGAEHLLGVDPCPHHEGAFVEAGIHVGDSAHTSHHAHHAGAPDPGSESEDHGPCGCVGPCATPAPTAPPSETTLHVGDAPDHVESASTPDRDSGTPQFVPFFLPYSNAPPSLA